MNVIRRSLSGLSAAGLLLASGACGAGRATQIGGAPSTSGGSQSVSFGGATFDVPAGWPVVDLTASPHHCARFDVHAVYRGHQAPDAACPARALGKTEAVQIEANDVYSHARVLPSAATAQVNGQAVAYEPGGDANHEIVATFPSLGVVVRVTYGTDAATARQVVASVRKSGA